jgi:hypothetical protein
MPQFLDLPKPPAYLVNRATASDSAVPTPTAVTTAPASKRFTPPNKKVNFGALTTQDSTDQSPITSSSTSTITAFDDWAPYDDTAVREVVNDPSNEKPIAQLAALVAATTIGQPSTPNTPSRSDRRPAYSDGRDTRHQPPESTMDRACYSFFVNGTCPRDKDCRYSHDDKIINEARLACMSKWRAGTKTVFSNLSIVDDTFPLDTGSGPGYTQAERSGVYDYVEEIVAAGQAARLP